jgi:hypothetical protein
MQGAKKRETSDEKRATPKCRGAKNKDNTKVTLQNKSHEGDPVNKDGT